MDSVDSATMVGSVTADSASAPKFQTAEAYGENLTCIGIPELKQGEGNVHTGATPPWLREDDDDEEGASADNHVIGPSFDAFKKHAERMKKINHKNPHRVGANFDRKKETSEDWLPSFGRVWNQGPRWQSRHDYRRENKVKKSKK